MAHTNNTTNPPTPTTLLRFFFFFRLLQLMTEVVAKKMGMDKNDTECGLVASEDFDHACVVFPVAVGTLPSTVDVCSLTGTLHTLHECFLVVW